MKLSTSTNLIAFRPDYVSYFPILDSMKRLKAVGFDAVDLNVSDAGQPFFRLGDDDWKEWMQEVAALSQELNLPITQSHAPFYNALEPESKKSVPVGADDPRAIEASGMAKVPWIVMHPGTYPDDAPDFRESKRRNYEYFMPYLELADRFGCGIAIENMADGFSTHRRPGGVYCSTHVELCDLVDSFHVSNVGICWDFGHANLMGIDQREALRVMGKRLKATHVADKLRQAGRPHPALPGERELALHSAGAQRNRLRGRPDLRNSQFHLPPAGSSGGRHRRSVRTGRPLSAGSGERQNSQ